MKTKKDRHQRYPAIVRRSLIIWVLLFAVIPTFSQFYNGSQLTFGKNRVQHKVDRFWTHYRYTSFDTYFYMGGREYALYAARYAMQVMPGMEKQIDYSLSEKVQFIIFNNFSELKESNIGLLSDESYNIGGVTYIVGTKIFLYFDGNYLSFEQQIRRGLAQVMLNELIYGSEITSQMKNSTLINFPEWYLNGLISYIADEWNVETDNQVRDGILTGRYKNFNSLTGQDAVNAGHSIWKYVADKYGATTIPNILYMTKVSRQINNGFLYVIGVPFKVLTKEWMNYFSKEYFQYDDDRQMPEGSPLPVRVKKEMVVGDVRLSPDGRYAAYVTNRSGRYRIMLYDGDTGKLKKLLRRGQKLDLKVDYSYPLLAWHPSSKLFTFMIEEKGYTWLYSYTVEENLLEKDLMSDFQKITSYSFSPNGELLVLSGVQRGQSDLFVFSRSSRTSEAITRDLYDDFSPRFIDQGRKIIFSTDRPSDTLIFDRITARIDTNRVIDRMPFTDIFIYDYQHRSPVLQRVTETSSFGEYQPMEYQEGYMTYLSEENGIINRHLARMDSTISFVDTLTHYFYFTESFPLTNYRRSVLGMDINRPGGELTEVIFENGKYHIFRSALSDAREEKGISMTNTSFRMQQLAKDAAFRRVDANGTAGKQNEDKELSPVKRRFVNVKSGQEYPLDSGIISTDSTIMAQQPASLRHLSEDQPLFFIPKERVYEVAFSINQLVSQVDLGYINSAYQIFTGGGQPIYINPGINSFFRLGLTDLLEDYRITGGARLSFNLQNNEFFLSFEDLKNRWDKQIILHRKAIESYSAYSIIRSQSHEVHYLLKYPFSNILAIKTGLILRLDRDVFLGTDLNNLLRTDIFNAWLTGHGELVFDNSRDRGMNTLFGARGKIFGEYYQKINDLDQHMVVLGGDFRHYTPIHRTFIWANRLALSTSFGNNRLIYYMGGVDNWLLPKFNSDINIDQNQHWTYQTLATNMRGFEQNIRNGNSFFVLNSELRFPVFRYLLNRPLRNNFLNHFQVIAFGDLGTAWTGSNPWSEQNALYTQTVEQGPIKVTVKRQVDPIVEGFGVGVRSSILGYFIRADWAWGIEDHTVMPSIFYLSLGLDF
jgi:hypothetical protein